jgi:hypothetical protein
VRRGRTIGETALSGHVTDAAFLLLRNACIQVKRAQMIEAGMQHLPALASLAYSIYVQPPMLRARGCVFEYLEGTQQGSVLSKLRFSLGIHSMVMEVVTSCHHRVNQREAENGTL